MTQRRRRRRARRGRFGRRAFLAGAGCAALAGAAVLLGRGQTASASSVPPTDEAEPNAALPTGEWRAVWVSYLEWAGMDFSSEEAFRAGAAALMDNCLSIGLNTVIAQVRPFGDALYRSTLFPWSHLCTGVQGQDPGFDPLDVLITEAHSRGLSLEAWVNPYRLRSSAKMPPALAENNLANVHPEWVCAVGEGLYLNPAIPEAADYVVQGVAELVQNYAVDGIHFDDYFYPTTDAALDAAQFAASGAGDLAAWRRQNVTALVKAAHDAVKAADATLRFGVSPQGNPDNDIGQQYSDVKAWLAAEGENAVVDYLCPQIYWGCGYTLQSGSTRFAFENIVPEWLAMPRAASTALYFGLGAYRIGEGDGGANEDSQSQWCTGSALARQVERLHSLGAGGWALYRYDSLFRSAWAAFPAARSRFFLIIMARGSLTACGRRRKRFSRCAWASRRSCLCWRAWPGRCSCGCLRRTTRWPRFPSGRSACVRWRRCRWARSMKSWTGSRRWDR